MNDSVLIEKLNKGDRNAFNSLYQRHSQACIRYASMLMSRSPESTDIVQDVFLKLWNNRESIAVSESLRPYLIKSVYNTSLNAIRNKATRHRFRNEYVERIEKLSAFTCDPDNNEIIRKLYIKERTMQISEVLELLPPHCRQIFRMSYMEEIPHKNIAADLSISCSTVNNQIYKALKILKKNLTKEHFYLLIFFFQYFS